MNCVGVMGAGLAKAFKAKYPSIMKPYKAVCDRGLLKIGNLQIIKAGNRNILNFPTKEHWNKPSEIEYIEKGLDKFLSMYKEKGISSIAFPKLGAGLGGLDWEREVKPLLVSKLTDIDIPVEIWE